MTEVEFFHPPSRTLILTDFIENFDPQKISSRFIRWLIELGGVQDPDGQMPRDMRLTFSKNEVMHAVETMIACGPERIILADARWYQRDGRRVLIRFFRWALA
jgi:hypothetical protein